MRPPGQGDGRVVLLERYPKVPQGEGQEGNGPPAPHPPGLLRPHLSTGEGCGQEAVGYKVRLFLKWRRQRAEKGRPQGEVYGSVPQGPTLSRGWRPQPR